MADYLVLKGVPFRQAHEITGKIVSYCLASKKDLEDLNLKELRKVSKQFDKDVFSHITLENSLRKKDVHGGTAKKQVLKQIARLNRLIK